MSDSTFPLTPDQYWCNNSSSWSLIASDNWLGAEWRRRRRHGDRHLCSSELLSACCCLFPLQTTFLMNVYIFESVNVTFASGQIRRQHPEDAAPPLGGKGNDVNGWGLRVMSCLTPPVTGSRTSRLTRSFTLISAQIHQRRRKKQAGNRFKPVALALASPPTSCH